jgi:hypothetical protein
MDRRRGRYFTLNEVGGRVWDLAGSGATPAETIERILSEYDVPRFEVERDVAATLQQLIDDRLLAPGTAPETAPPRFASDAAPETVEGTVELRTPGMLRCGLLLVWFKGLLRVRGFLGTLEWIRLRVGRISAGPRAEIETVRAVEYRVALAGALYPGRAKCLEQSLTLYYILRRQGVAAIYCQGVQPYPFQAHAWIEFRGEVINDVPEHTGFFARLPEQLP